MAIYTGKVSRGTHNPDTFTFGYQYDYYFGLQGEDTLRAVDVPVRSELHDAVVAAGGTGSDSYIWDGTGTLLIVENGGANDSYYDLLNPYGTPLQYAAELDGTHLAMWSPSGPAIIFANYKDPSAKIENFYLLMDTSGLYTHFSYDEFVNTLKSVPLWQGSLSYQQLGITHYREALFEDLIVEVTQLSNEYEAEPLPRDAGKDDVAKLGRLYKAAFDRKPDIGGLNYWVDEWEDNMSPLEVAARFYYSEEFNLRYGNPSNEGFIDLLYENVLDRDPDAGGLEYWVGELNSGMDRSEVLARFAESTENVANTDFIFYTLHEETDGYWIF